MNWRRVQTDQRQYVVASGGAAHGEGQTGPFAGYPSQARADSELLRPAADRFIIEGSTTGSFCNVP
jgi:hypothetical protein